MDDPLFRNGGELGRAMAERDWGSTAVGSPHTWPAALRNMVRIVLTSRFSMWMAWGPELTFFYNDAYRRDTLGAKHPWALGRPAREVWAEIWDDIGPRIERCWRPASATWDEDLLLFLERSGYPEETYHTFSYSPLADDDGRVAGMLCVVTEDTDAGRRRTAAWPRCASSPPPSAATPHRARASAAPCAPSSAGNRADLPFTLVYLFDDGRQRAPGSPGAPASRAGSPGRARRRSAPTTRRRLAAGPAARRRAASWSTWPTGSPTCPPGRGRSRRTPAVVVPLATSGQARPAGFLVVGLNPHRPFDDALPRLRRAARRPDRRGPRQRRRLRGGARRAEALAELDRAKTDVLLQRQPRVPHAADADARAARRATRSPGAHADARRRSAELEIVHRNGLRLLQLVNTLLDFSRLEAGRVEARFEPVDLAALTAELASMFRSAVERAGLGFAVDCPPLQPVYVDRDMWEKIVLNLLSNAFKFTFEGGITRRRCGGPATPRVLTVARHRHRHRRADELPRLFERFHRVERARGAHPRARHRPGAGPRAGRAARRHDHGRERAGRGTHVHRDRCRWAPRTCPPEQVAPEATRRRRRVRRALRRGGAALAAGGGRAGASRPCRAATDGRDRPRWPPTGRGAGRRRQRRHARVPRAGC